MIVRSVTFVTQDNNFISESINIFLNISYRQGYKCYNNVMTITLYMTKNEICKRNYNGKRKSKIIKYRKKNITINKIIYIIKENITQN